MTEAKREYVTKDAPNGFALLPPLPCIKENITEGNKWIKNMQSHQLSVIRNCSNAKFAVLYNQRIRGLVMINCKNCQLQVLDSAVFVTQTCTFINCENCEFVFEDVDIRTIELYGAKNCRVVLISSPPLTERATIYWREEMALGTLLDHRLHFGIPFKIYDTTKVPDCKETTINSFVDPAEEMKWTTGTINYESVDEKLRKLEEMEKIPYPFSDAELEDAYNQEKREYYDTPEEIRIKAKEIISILKEANHTICYTGAGVSTSANIPDFRGPTGVWTNKERGRETKGVDIHTVHPTLTHYALTHLTRINLIHFLITSNVDGLHLRSGIPPYLLVEHHGNVYKEVCEKCGKNFFRSYGVEHVGQHYTGWFCNWCNGKLRDTHVGFGENVTEGDLGISLVHARRSDVSFILGTSMNVQPSVAFQLLPKKKKNGKLILVNLQKTPYDDQIDIRVFARTDDFMQILMEELNETNFDMTTDCLPYWDSYELMIKEQTLLKQDGPSSLSTWVKVKEEKRKNYKISAARALEGAAFVGLGVAIGFILRMYLKK